MAIRVYVLSKDALYLSLKFNYAHFKITVVKQSWDKC